MTSENIFPPIPCEVIMPLAGCSAADGELSIPLVILTGTIRATAGVFFWWWMASRCGAQRLRRWADSRGRWLTLSAADIDHIDRWFDRLRSWAILIAHVIPSVRNLISIPTGFFDTKLCWFVALTVIGATARNGILAAMSYWLGRAFGAINRYLEIAAMIVIGAMLLHYIYRVVTFRSGSHNA